METTYLPGLLGKPEEGMYRVLLAHNPDYFPYYAAWGADLTLSGHVHGGIVNFPGLGGVIAPSLKLFPKYDAGLYRRKGADGVKPGTGNPYLTGTGVESGGTDLPGTDS